jgi:two-component system, NtrC family, response regulator HydG
MAKKILIIDDDIDLCILLSRFLTKNGFETETAHSGEKGIAVYGKSRFDAVICDYRLGDMDGIKLMKAIKELDPRASIIVITGYSDIKTAVEVIKLGAFDYITKPLIPDEVLAILNKITADKTEGPVRDRTNLHSDGERGTVDDPDYYAGESAAAVFLHKQVNIVAGTNYSVILYGESGTGKEVIAQRIHELSPWSDKNFVALDCGTLSRELAGSELFGHVKGSFTGAIQDKEGHFEMANGGTLFLDEVGNLSLDVQATLLRVIQERKFKRVGGNKEIPANVRIIVASNENLQEAYRKGKFREDLYHRFNEFSIHLPPLRERRDDIPPLSEFFLKKSCAETNKIIRGFDHDVREIFQSYNWPGNLRELRNVVRRAVLLTDPGESISLTSLPYEIAQHTYNPPEKKPLVIAREDLLAEDKDLLKGAASKAEYDTIMAVLQQVNFNKKKAAALLNIDRKTLYNKIKNFQSLHQS